MPQRADSSTVRLGSRLGSRLPRRTSRLNRLIYVAPKTMLAAAAEVGYSKTA